MMDFLAVNKQTRWNTLKVIEGLSLSQLNTVPKGLNNSIAWNVGHMWVTQQLLVYKLSGNEMRVSIDLVDKYRKGSDGRCETTSEEWELILDSFIGFIDQTQKDIDNHLFSEYSPYQTSYNVSLNSVAEAIAFNNVHEALHLGVIMTIKKWV